ncbi:MAG: protein translocase subunit SecF [Patescibacteria group bacterium]|nr:protein translocase subunit SecF [Patescibacteria group bacterium]
MNINIIGRKKIFLTIALILVLLSAGSVAFFRFRLGVDFAGGTVWDVKIPNATPSQIKTVLEQAGAVSPIVAYDSVTKNYSITLPEITEDQRNAYLSAMQTKFGAGVESQDFWSLSPSVSASLARRAILAIIFVLAGISLFVAYAFRRVSRPVSSWKYGFITLLTLLHDVIIPAGAYAAIGYFFGLTIDTNFIIALLVIMGFSVHDTIVVFDRTRENLSREKGKIDLPDVVNRSVNETMHRSINTSFSLALVLLALYFLGPGNLKFFALTLLIGIIAGTYSSIFVASPLLVMSNREGEKDRK